MRIANSTLIIFLSGILSALALTIPHGYHQDCTSDDCALVLDSYISDRAPQPDVWEEVLKRTTTKPPAKPVAGKPVAGKPVAGKPVAGKPVAGKPVAGKPVAGKPVAGKPVAGNPATAKPPATPATGKPVPGKPPVQPVQDKVPYEDLFVLDKYKVPYSKKAEDTCVGLITCKEQLEATSEESESGVARRDSNHLAKRSRTINVFNGGMILKPASYYYAFEIYAEPRNNNPKAVLDFQTDSVESHKMVAKAVQPASTLNLITEHIIELQTIAMFLDTLAVGDTTLEANLKKLWGTNVDPVKVKGLANIPWRKTLPKSLTFGNLVFHAMGSKINPNANVLFNKEVNNMKEGVWAKDKLVEEKKYKALFEGVAKGKTDSAKLHSVHRNVLAVFDYLQNPDIASRVKTIVEEMTEIMKNAEDLTGQDLKDGKAQPVSLDTKFTEYMKQHFKKTEEWGQEWLKDAITLAETEFEKEIVTLKANEQTIRGKVRNKDKAKRRDYFLASKKELDTIMAARKPIETKLEKLKKEVQTEKAKVDKIEVAVAKATRVAQKTKARRSGDWEKTVLSYNNKKKELLVPQEEWNLNMRKYNELYASRVKQIWMKLEEDLKIMRDRKAKLSTLIKMPALP